MNRPPEFEFTETTRCYVRQVRTSLFVKSTSSVIAALILSGCGLFGGAPPVDVKKSDAALATGMAAQAKGDYKGALAAFDEAVKHNPKNKYALYNIAVIDFTESRTAKAEAGYRRVLAIDGRYEPAIYNLAVIEQINGDEKAALALFQRAVQADPSDANAHYNLALLLRAIPKYRDDGDEQMKIALRLDPSLKDPMK